MMSQRFKRGSKGRTNSSTSPDMATVFRAWPYGRFIEIQSNLRKKKLHGTNPTFLNTETTGETFQQFGKQGSFRHMLKSSPSMYESSGS